MRAKYKKDYDEFYKSINTYISGCQYFIKTDITNFFSNINLDILIKQIDKRSNVGETHFTANDKRIIFILWRWEISNDRK